MRKCPFCAEDIQDAAQLCKHCGRKLTTNGSTRSGRRLWVLVGVLAATIVTAGAVTVHQRELETARVTADRAREAERLRIADSIRRVRRERFLADSVAAAKPVSIVLANDPVAEIPPNTNRAIKFVLPPMTKNCKVLGRVHGLAGGNKDVDVFLFTDDQFVAWDKRSSSPHTTWETFRSADVTLDYQLYGAGTYYLVISNAFSTITRKTVQIDAQLKCTNEPRPVIRE